jgi:type II secretory pathway pseudopilin PulG
MNVQPARGTGDATRTPTRRRELRPVGTGRGSFHRSPWARPGFGLLEVILVFALVIGAGAVVFTVFQSASLRHRASTTIEQVNTVVANVQSSTFAAPDQSASLTNDQAIKAGILTPGLQTNAFGGAIEVNADPASVPREFRVVIRNVPREACPDLLTSVAANPTWTWAQMGNPQPAGSGNLPTGVMVDTYLVAQNKSNFSLIMSRCSLVNGAASGDVLDFQFAFNYSVLH